jgi:hypothetical protein
MSLRPLRTLALALTTLAAACSSSSGGGTGTAGTSGGSAGTSGGVGGTTGSAGTGGAAAGTGGGGTAGVTGDAGTSGTAGVNGTAGTSGSAGSGGHAGAGSTGTAGSGGTGGGSASACPANATFCSGFESAALPTGAVYLYNGAPGLPFTADFQIDTTQHHSGNSSLRVKETSESGTSGSAYRMLAVPGTSGAFWARFWVQSSVDMGDSVANPSGHNAFAGGSGSTAVNDSTFLQFCEDVGIAFNYSDTDRWPTGYGRTSSGGTVPYILPKMTWACVEISFDSTTMEQQLFINGTQLIDATGYPASTASPFAVFKFGLETFAGPDRQMWYDDVVVAPTRIGGCS